MSREFRTFRCWKNLEKICFFCCWLPTTKQQQRTHKVLPCCCDCRELALCWLVAHCNFDWPFFCKQAHTTSEIHTHCRWHFSYSLTVRAMTWKVDQSHVTLSCRQKKNIFTSVSRKKKAVNCFSNLFILISDVVGRALKWNENDRARDVDGGREASKKVKMITDSDSSHSFTLNSAAARCFLPLTSFVLFCENVWITYIARPLRVPRRMDGWENHHIFHSDDDGWERE